MERTFEGVMYDELSQALCRLSSATWKMRTDSLVCNYKLYMKLDEMSQYLLKVLRNYETDGKFSDPDDRNTTVCPF